VVEVVNHVVFCDPTNEAARLLQADALEQLGYQSESGPWRDFYLSAAMELRSDGTALKGLRGNALGPGLVASMTPELLLDLIGVRLNAARSASFRIEVNLIITDPDTDPWTFGVRHGVLHARRLSSHDPCDVTIRSSIDAFAQFASSSQPIDETLARDDFDVEGDQSTLIELNGYLDVFEFGFELVMPRGSDTSST